MGRVLRPCCWALSLGSGGRLSLGGGGLLHRRLSLLPFAAPPRLSLLNCGDGGGGGGGVVIRVHVQAVRRVERGVRRLRPPVAFAAGNEFTRLGRHRLNVGGTATGRTGMDPAAGHAGRRGAGSTRARPHRRRCNSDRPRRSPRDGRNSRTAVRRVHRCNSHQRRRSDRNHATSVRGTATLLRLGARGKEHRGALRGK